MLLLHDENLPKRLKNDFRGHKILTIKECGWNGINNGLLLQKLLENNFDALIIRQKHTASTKLQEISYYSNCN